MDSQTNEMLFILTIILLVIVIFIQVFSIIFQERFQTYFTKRSKKGKKNKRTTYEIDAFINNMSTSLARLSFNKVGGIIVIENRDNLNKYIDLGVKVEAEFSPEFIVSVFYNHKSPLHDGAPRSSCWSRYSPAFWLCCCSGRSRSCRSSWAAASSFWAYTSILTLRNSAQAVQSTSPAPPEKSPRRRNNSIP